MAYVLQDSVMGVCHISSVLIVLGPKLEFKKGFGSFGWIHNSGVAYMCCVDTDVVAHELRFTISCGGHGGGDNLRITLVWELFVCHLGEHIYVLEVIWECD